MPADFIISALTTGLQVVGLYVLADFLGGLFHWAEDTLGREDTPLWGSLFVQPNGVHHEHPERMNRIPWYINNIANVVGVLLIVALVWAAGALSWQVLVLGLFAMFNQQVHRFAHTPSVRLPRLVRWLQRSRLIQDPRHHWRHHTDPHVSHYCVLTPWVNPVLDRIGFWRGLERLLVPLFGAHRRPDLEAKSWDHG